MASFTVRPVRAEDRDWIRRFIAERWLADVIAVHAVLYHPADLTGFVAEAEGERIGLLTYQIVGGACEIVTLDSLRSGIGVGTMLIEAVKAVARAAGCWRIWCVTTNDKLAALRFYQKRGFRLAAVHPNAAEAARRLKPQIPLVGEAGIPIRDEYEVELLLD